MYRILVGKPFGKCIIVRRKRTVDPKRADSR